MEKEKLKKEWIDEIMDFLPKYEWKKGRKYPVTEYGAQKIVAEEMKQKKKILELFEKHPGYNGRGQIILTEEYHRDIDLKKASVAAEKLCQYVSDEKLSRLIWEYFHMGSVVRSAIDHNMTAYWEQVMDAKYLRKEYPLHLGEKTSRRLRKWLITDEVPDRMKTFEKVYADLADALNPLSVVRYTVFSIHPIDFYSMSFGNSWTSCQTIDKTGLRGIVEEGEGESGSFSSGTESYMLDPSTFVVYTIDKDADIRRPELQPKITRQLFHMSQDQTLLIQGRLYPQSNDNGAAEQYKQMREIAERVICDCNGAPNRWSYHGGTGACKKQAASRGTHYADYKSNETCGLAVRCDSLHTTLHNIVIGAEPICPNCGKRHGQENNICCYDCTPEYICVHCGKQIRRDKAIMGRAYRKFYAFCSEDCAAAEDFILPADCELYRPEDLCIFDEYENKYYFDDRNAVYTIDGRSFASVENAEKAGYIFCATDEEFHPENGPELEPERCCTCNSGILRGQGIYTDDPKILFCTKYCAERAGYRLIDPTHAGKQGEQQ